jgi:hypothetical protein
MKGYFLFLEDKKITSYFSVRPKVKGIFEIRKDGNQVSIVLKDYKVTYLYGFLYFFSLYLLVIMGCAFFLFGSSYVPDYPDSYNELISILISILINLNPFTFLFFIFLLIYSFYILFSINDIQKERKYLSKNGLLHLNNNECVFLTLNLRFYKKKIIFRDFYFSKKEWNYFKVPLKHIEKVEIVKDMIIYPLFDNNFANFLSQKLKLAYIFNNVIILWINPDYIYGYRVIEELVKNSYKSLNFEEVIKKLPLDYDPYKDLIIKEIDIVRKLLSASRVSKYDEKDTGDNFFYGLIYRYKDSYFTILPTPIIGNLNILNKDDFRKNLSYITDIFKSYFINIEVKDRIEFNKD